MMAHHEPAYEHDMRIRLYDDRASPDGVVILAEDSTPGLCTRPVRGAIVAAVPVKGRFLDTVGRPPSLHSMVGRSGNHRGKEEKHDLSAWF